MPERKQESRPSHEEANPSSPPIAGNAFRRAESLVEAGNESGDDRARETVLDLEYRQADGPSRPADLNAIRQKTKGKHGANDSEAHEKEVDAALEEKSIEESVATANDTARIVRDLSSHNM